MKKQIFYFPVMLLLVFISCNKNDYPEDPVYPPTLANDWMKMHIRLTLNTAGYNSIVSDRSFGYAGIAMYESVKPGSQEAFPCSNKSGVPGVPSIPITKDKNEYYWPAAMNAAMAYITRQLFESSAEANLLAIDSLQNAYKTKFASEASAEQLANAESYGLQVATIVFNWSKTDGSDQAYKHLNDPAYVPPTGPGKWVPTAPAFAPALLPHWGDNRSFISNSASLTQPDAPIAYSEDPASDFYKMVNEVYTVFPFLITRRLHRCAVLGRSAWQPECTGARYQYSCATYREQPKGSVRGSSSICPSWHCLQ